MNNTQNTTIMLLLVTAAILAAMLIPSFDQGGSVAYGNVSARQGKYVIATGGYNLDIDLVYVVNLETQKLCVYAPNLAKRMIDKMGVALPLQATSRRR